MFDKKNTPSKTNTFQSQTNLISAGTIINGNIDTENDLRFDGVLTGNIESKGKFVLGLQGKIIGNIVCKSADIEGYVQGNLSVSEMLSIKSNATIIGEMIVGQLSVEPGSQLEAKCKMMGGSLEKQDAVVK